MRYWIWWNDLVQGPFEIEELTRLSAFAEDLPVCMEGRTDWLPASRVADLAPAVEALRSRQMQGTIPPPPAPPPPKRPPQVVPLQGEMFAAPPNQEWLFETPSDQPKGPFAYHPVDSDGNVALDSPPMPFTMPIKLVRTVVVEVPLTGKAAPGPDAPAKVLPEMPEHEDLQVLEPEPEIEPVRELEVESESEAEPQPQPQPQPKPKPKPESEPPPRSEPEPVVLPKPKVIPELKPQERPTLPPLSPSWETRPQAGMGWKWLLRVAASASVLALIVTSGYWLMDWFSTREALASVRKPVAPVTVSKPIVSVPPPPAPVRVKPAITPAVKPVPPRKAAASPAKAVKPARPAATAAPKPKPPAAVKPAPTVAPAIKLPGVSNPKPAPAPVVQASPPPAPAPQAPRIDPWKDKQRDAIQRVMGSKIIGGQISIADQAKAMLNEMHDKELLHAMATGERLFLPDKVSWSALREDGARYRVYLNFSALQANGERTQARSYQFSIDLEKGAIDSDDNATRQDFLSATQKLGGARQASAKDLDNVLSGVDALNKQRLRSMVVGRNKRNKDEIASAQKAVEAARQKVRTSIVYFRTQHPEKSIQNAAKAYAFSELLQ